MTKEEKRKKSSPRGSRKTERSDFSSRVLDEAEKLDLKEAADVDGIDNEIAVLRVKIKSVLEKDPENIRLIMQATNTLAGLVKTRYRIGKEQRQGLKEAIGNVLKDVAIPLGISIGTKALGE